jgi:hypothetical protein
MIETLRKLISTNRRMIILLMEERLEIIIGTILKIIVEILGKRKVCAMCVPHCFTDEQKALRLPACQECIQSVDDDRCLLDSIVTGDETWCFENDPPPKKNKVCNGALVGSPTQTKGRSLKKNNKVRLVTFFDSRKSFEIPLFHQVIR